VLVLRQGEVIEPGPPADVLYRRRHQYTRLLISSISKTASAKFLDSGALSLADHRQRDALMALLRP